MIWDCAENVDYSNLVTENLELNFGSTESVDLCWGFCQTK